MDKGGGTTVGRKENLEKQPWELEDNIFKKNLRNIVFNIEFCTNQNINQK